MFSRAAIVLFIVAMIASPAVAGFEEEAEFHFEIANYLSPHSIFIDGTMCQTSSDLQFTNRVELAKPVEETEHKSLLMALTGTMSHDLSKETLPFVACN